jgi:hypothetical protein
VEHDDLRDSVYPFFLRQPELEGHVKKLNLSINMTRLYDTDPVDQVDDVGGDGEERIDSSPNPDGWAGNPTSETSN